MAYPRVTERVEQAEAGLRQSGKAATTAGVTPELVKVLAAQIVLEKQKDAQAAINRQLETNPKTIAAQQQEAMGINEENSLQNKVAGVRGALQHKEGQQRQRLAQVGQGATPPPNVANTGIAPARPPTMQMAQGGIVGFQRGGGISDAEIAKWNKMSPEDWQMVGPQGQVELRRLAEMALAPDASEFDKHRARLGANLALKNLREHARPGWGQRAVRAVGQYFSSPDPEAEKRDQAEAAKQAMFEKVRAADAPAAFTATGTTTGTDGGVGGGRWGGPEHKADVFGPTPDKRASLPPPPDPLAVAQHRGELINTGDFTKDIKLPDAWQSIWGTGKDGKPQVPQTSIERRLSPELIKGARDLTGINPVTRRDDAQLRAQKAFGISETHAANERARQADLRGIDAQLGDRARAQQASAMDYIRGQAINPYSGGMQAQAAGDEARAQQLRARLKDRQGEARVWETTERTVGKDVHTTAENAFNKAEDRIAKGYDILSQVDSEDRATMTANTRLLMEAKVADRKSEDHHIQVTLYAALDLAEKGMKGAIANQVQKTAEARLQLEAVKIKLAEGRLDRKDLQTAIAKAEQTMKDSFKEYEELYLDRKALLEQQYSNDPEKLDEMLEAMYANKRAILGTTIGPIAARVKALQAQWEVMQVTGVKQISSAPPAAKPPPVLPPASKAPKLPSPPKLPYAIPAPG